MFSKRMIIFMAPALCLVGFLAWRPILSSLLGRTFKGAL